MKSLFLLLIIFSFMGEKTTDEIYVSGEYIFSLKIYKNDKEVGLKFIPSTLTNDKEGRAKHENAWKLIPAEEIHKNRIVYIGMKMLGGTINGGQKAIGWNFYNDDFNKQDQSATGLIENDSLIWLHPPRARFFKILQINPYPEVRFYNDDWSTELAVGQQWGNKRWKTWTGNAIISSDYTYKNEVITANATSKLGTTKLVSTFNKTDGFTKFDYTNIDGSRVILELIEKRN